MLVAGSARVLDYAPMGDTGGKAEAADGVAEAEPAPAPEPWPELPADCPTDGAAPMAGPVYRLARSESDWTLPIVEKGPGYVPPEGVAICRFHAFSVYLNKDDAAALRRRRKKLFKNHKIARIQVTKTMGDLLQNAPDTDTHLDWWPSDEVLAPPPFEWVE